MIRAVLILLALGLPAAAQQERVVAGLSQTRVAITADFDGSEILIFGAIRRDAPVPEDAPPLEVIVTVTGPAAPVDIRRKSRVWGIWINTDAVEIDEAPRFYAVATTGPLFDVVSHTEDLRHRISIPMGIRSVGAPPQIADSARFTQALIRLRKETGLYQLLEGAVQLREESLFQTRIQLPANLTEGNHDIRIFLTRDRQVLDSYTTVLGVNKVGVERFLYLLAHEQPALYGLLSLVLAGFMGWGASTAFRYLRS